MFIQIYDIASESAMLINTDSIWSIRPERGEHAGAVITTQASDTIVTRESFSDLRRLLLMRGTLLAQFMGMPVIEDPTLAPGAIRLVSPPS